jgi:hypothetical protein
LALAENKTNLAKALIYDISDSPAKANCNSTLNFHFQV